MSPPIQTAHRPVVISGERVTRYSFAERVIHWIGSFSYVYVLLSGLALYSPYLYWIAAVLGGGPAVRFWHPWFGLIFMVGLLAMHKVWRRDMKITEVDKRWMKHVREYVENRDEQVPPSGRFNAGQKQFYWIMFIAGFFLLASGIVMWFPEWIPGSANWVRGLAILVHEIAALVSIGAFILHIFMGLFMVPGSLTAIIEGYVSPEWARSHHLLWYRSVEKPKTE